MKRFLILTLLMLTLAGCTAENTDPSDMETADAAGETENQGLYVSGSVVEQQSGGAVRLYDLPQNEYLWLSSIGDKLLLASQGDTAKLTVLTGVDCVQTAEIELPGLLLSGSVQATYSGFIYYDQEQKQAVILDPQLQETGRIDLPDAQGQPLFSSDGGEIFYCTGQDIRGLEIERNISRLIKSHSFSDLSLEKCYFDGKLISCRATDAQGNVNTIYVSTQTGQTMRKDDNITALYTYENNYLALRLDSVVRQQIVGTMDGPAQQCNVSDPYMTSALALGGVVSYSVGEGGLLQMSFLDLTTGKKTAGVSLDGMGAPQAFLADRWSGCLWFLAADPFSGDQALFRWDVKASAVEEENTYIGTLYTAAAPDEAGLDACSDRAAAINKTHGVRVRIWNEAVKTPGAYTLEAEFQTAAINKALDQLESVLAEFPKNFLLKSIPSRIRICIVRSVNGEEAAAQYWDENDAFIVLSAGGDIRTDFLKGLGYVVDSHVLGNSSKYDAWNSLNPEGFVYGQEKNDAYLTGETRAFVDETAMTSALEDRSRILWQAMQPENGELFQSELMQKKLLLICQGIRDAWNLERKAETYPWEQYLTQSIAYQK